MLQQVGTNEDQESKQEIVRDSRITGDLRVSVSDARVRKNDWKKKPNIYHDIT